MKIPFPEIDPQKIGVPVLEFDVLVARPENGRNGHFATDPLGRDSDRAESGGIILIVALMLPVIAMLVALAVDTGRLQTAQSEKLFTADHLAVGALQVYLEAEPPDPEPIVGQPPPPPPTDAQRHVYKFAQAMGRAADLGQQNYLSSRWGEKEIENMSDLTSDPSTFSTRTKKALIEPGRYYVRSPAYCSSTDTACPCGITSDNPVPCFEPCSPSTGCPLPSPTSEEKIFASAIRVTLSTTPDSGIKYFFTKAAGLTVDEGQVSATNMAGYSGSIAVAMPKYGALLFDLSRYMQTDTYLPYEKGNPAAKEYSYQLNNNPGVCNGSSNPCGAGCSVKESRCQEETCINNTATFGYQATYNALGAAQSNYLCYNVKRNGVDEYHLVNLDPNSPAEPYNTLMVGLRDVIDKIKESANSSDRLALIGYDHGVIPERVIKFTDTGSDEYLQMVKIASSRDEASKAFFFPRTDARADLSRALLYAKKMIDDENLLSRVDPYFVLFSNGMENCEQVTKPDEPPRCGRYPVSSDPSGYKNMLYDRHLLAMEEALGVTGAQFLRTNKIKVHTVPSSVLEKNHSILIRHAGEPRCMKDDEKRRAGVIDVIAPLMTTAEKDQERAAFMAFGQDASKFYSQPLTYLYSLSSLTQGEYMPLRKQCTNFTNADMDSLCASRGSVPVISGLTNNRRQEARNFAVKKAAADGQVDAMGRILCSPTENPVALGSEQIAVQKLREQLKDFLTKRPIYLVSQDATVP